MAFSSLTTTKIFLLCSTCYMLVGSGTPKAAGFILLWEVAVHSLSLCWINMESVFLIQSLAINYLPKDRLLIYYCFPWAQLLDEPAVKSHLLLHTPAFPCCLLVQTLPLVAILSFQEYWSFLLMERVKMHVAVGLLQAVFHARSY